MKLKNTVSQPTVVGCACAWSLGAWLGWHSVTNCLPLGGAICKRICLNAAELSESTRSGQIPKIGVIAKLSPGLVESAHCVASTTVLVALVYCSLICWMATLLLKSTRSEQPT